MALQDKHYEAYLKIGLNILYYRKRKGITQEKLAELTSYSRNHIQQIETANAVPGLSALLDIADTLEIPVEKLFAGR